MKNVKQSKKAKTWTVTLANGKERIFKTEKVLTPAGFLSETEQHDGREHTECDMTFCSPTTEHVFNGCGTQVRQKETCGGQKKTHRSCELNRTSLPGESIERLGTQKEGGRVAQDEHRQNHRDEVPGLSDLQ